MKRSLTILLAILLVSASALAQHTTVSAQVKDVNNTLYANCTGSANFRGQNTNPGSGPYTLNGSPFQTVVPLFCDGAGNFTLSLSDNNLISPTPSQWNFSICSAIGAFPGPPFCFNALITITGLTQNITSQIQAAATILPISGGGLPPAGSGSHVVTTNLSGGGVNGNCAEWLTGGVLGDQGAPCGSGGGGGISGTLTQNFVMKASSTGLNPTVVNTTIQETGAPPNVTIPRFEQSRSTDAFIWSQSPSVPATIAIGSNTVNITCVYGIDSSFPDYFVDIGGTGTAEYVPVTATTCTSGTVGSPGTITVTAKNTHSAGYTVGTASVGVQEAINDCEVNSSGEKFCRVVIPCAVAGAAINWDAPVETHGNRITIDGGGCARIQITHQQQGLILGTHVLLANFFNNVEGISFAPNFAASPQVNLIQSMSRTGCPGSCVSTITFTGNHDFSVGDWIMIAGNLNDNTFAGEFKVVSTPAANQITVGPAMAGGAGNNPSTVYAGGWAVKASTPIEDNLSLAGHVANINLISASLSGKFMFGFIENSDQSLTLYGFDNQGSGNVFVTPTDEYIAPMIYAPGPSNPNGGVAMIYGLNCGLQLDGNCIDWTSGDDLYVTDSIIQGYVRFGIKVSIRRGGFGTLSMKGMHWEPAVSGTVTSIGIAGVLSNGMPAALTGNAPFGLQQVYTPVGNQLLKWFYYVEPFAKTTDPMCVTQPADGVTGVSNTQRCSQTYGTGAGPLLLAGSVLVDSVTGGTVTVNWAAIPGATSYKVYRVNAATNPGINSAPFGTGNYLIGTANPLTSCNDVVCSLSDTVGLTPSNDTIADYVTGSYFPYVTMWGGEVVLGGNVDAGGANLTPNSGSYTGPLSFYNSVSIELAGQDRILAESTLSTAGSNMYFKGRGSIGFGGTPTAGWATLQTAKLTAPGLPDAGTYLNLKGLYNFGSFTAYTKPYGLITWEDSNYRKTQAAWGHRPFGDAGDCESGMDQTQGYYTRCGTSQSEYINSLADGTSWSRRLTSTADTYKVPIVLDSVTFGSLPASPNGAILYCSDCNATCTAGAGTGRTCFRENGAWTH